MHLYLTFTITVPSFRSFQSVLLFYLADRHTHIHREKVIAISVPLYYVVVGTDNPIATNFKSNSGK